MMRKGGFSAGDPAVNTSLPGNARVFVLVRGREVPRRRIAHAQGFGPRPATGTMMTVLPPPLLLAAACCRCSCRSLPVRGNVRTVLLEPHPRRTRPSPGKPSPTEALWKRPSFLPNVMHVTPVFGPKRPCVSCLPGCQSEAFLSRSSGDAGPSSSTRLRRWPRMDGVARAAAVADSPGSKDPRITLAV